MHKDQIAITSFYSFVDIQNIEIILPKILLVCKKKYLKGTILLAKEGFNGSLSGSEENIKFALEWLVKLTSSQNLNVKTNYSNIHPFKKLKVKLKKEIVTLGVGEINVDNLRGEYLDSNEWEQFILKDDVIIVDTRNDYEVSIGTFVNAINPKTSTFKEFPEWVENNKKLLENKKIGMFCTGGIRCEKSTAYLKNLGYKEVYHLQGGILQYLEDTNNSKNLWQGECFVFDDRGGVDEGLNPLFNKN